MKILDALWLSIEVAIIKVETHEKRDSTTVKGNAITNHYVK